MPTGFVQRWKGKIAPRVIYMGPGATIIALSTVAGASYTVTANDMASLAGTTSVLTATTVYRSTATPMPASGVTIIPDTTVNSTYYLADPWPGAQKWLVVASTLGSTGVRSVVTASTGVVIIPSTIGNADRAVFGTSATQMVLGLFGMSTTQWLIDGTVYNPSSVANSTQIGPTLSTRA